MDATVIAIMKSTAPLETRLEQIERLNDAYRSFL